ncbi:MAG: hypothetical protein JXA42_16740 [Anaerolineales bacterium]|nr:hypothetical protein [Anaerolineales bacterium]
MSTYPRIKIGHRDRSRCSGRIRFWLDDADERDGARRRDTSGAHSANPGETHPMNDATSALRARALAGMPDE